MVKAVTGLLIVLFMQLGGYAQPADLLRLQATIRDKEIKKDYATDSSYIDALNNIAFAYYRINADSLFLYSNKALAYARKAKYSAGESTALRQLGNGYMLKGDYTNMLACYHQALAIAEHINNPGLTGKASINIAMRYIDMGKYDEALTLLEKAKHYFEETHDSLNLNKSILAIGVIWYSRDQFDKAIQYYRQAIQMATAMKNDYLVVTDNEAIGVVLLKKGLYTEALAGYLRAMAYFSHTDDKMRRSMTSTQISKSYFGLKRYPEALKYALQGLELASAVKAKAEMKDASHILGNIYEATGEYKNAIRYLQAYNELSDSLFSDQLLKNSAKLEARYEYEKKELELKAEQAKKDTLHRDIVRNKELEISFAISAILFLSILAFVLFRSRAVKQKANEALEIKNGKISRQKGEIEHQSLQLLINNQQKDKLFGIIAHDLRTPLQSLNMTLDLLKTKSLSEAQINRMMDELKRDADYSSGLVKNLLYWANSQLKGIAAVPVTLHLRQLTDDVLGLFPIQAAEKKIAFHNELDPAVAGYADKDMMHLVMRNLVSNAVKFCRPGDAITITGQPAGEAVEICIADTGMGIEKEVLDKIKAKRIVTSFGSANEKGTGIGLLLCREFIELNHGLFRIESEWGKGNRCYITLPVFPRAV